jgi:hypothetical protein
LSKCRWSLTREAPCATIHIGKVLQPARTARLAMLARALSMGRTRRQRRLEDPGVGRKAGITDPRAGVAASAWTSETG